MTLKEIAKHSGPVKQYLQTFIVRYEKLFASLRDKPLTILELGIGGYKYPNKGGGSLRMWAEYFPNAVIVGLDHYSKQLQLPVNVEVYTGSQTDTELLSNLATKYNGFDIVIDDASHVTKNTITSFETLIPHTRLFYIIEDLHMSASKGAREYFQHIPSADFDTLNLCVITK